MGRRLEEENKSEVLIPLLKKEVFAAIQAFVAELGADINAASLDQTKTVLRNFLKRNGVKTGAEDEIVKFFDDNQI